MPQISRTVGSFALASNEALVGQVSLRNGCRAGSLRFKVT